MKKIKLKIGFLSIFNNSEFEQDFFSCENCDCYSKPCYCDRSDSNDEENEGTDRD